MIKSILAAILLFSPTLAHSEDSQPEKPSNICNTTCQPLGNHRVCSKHCWSYKGGPGAVLVQTTVTWTSGTAMVKKPIAGVSTARSSE